MRLREGEPIRCNAVNVAGSELLLMPSPLRRREEAPPQPLIALEPG
jgi:hypothetical protein